MANNTSQEGSPQLKPDTSEETPPPLPPRPENLTFLAGSGRPQSSAGSVKGTQRGSLRPSLLQSKATTALSLEGSGQYTHGETISGSSTPSRQPSLANIGYNYMRSASDVDDTASIRSAVPPSESGVGDVESLLGDVVTERDQTAFESVASVRQDPGLFEETLFGDAAELEKEFETELDEIDELKTDGSNQESVMKAWRSKLKHYLILSSAGKPIYSRHGDDHLITNYIGIIQTIISFYNSADDPLRSFTAGDARFAILSRGYLNLVAISRLHESFSELRAQLEALYMQILSTLTLPNMERMFSSRPSTDLRRPLQGTESLLSALADGFTRGSPSTLLSALECLKLRKAHRNAINNTLLKCRTPSLLYGLIVANGRLVSVVRPKKHSLHPGDLHLVFNMLFEAGGVKAGGGENWIPLCLPGFNNTGYLYMYVSFLSASRDGVEVEERRTADGKGEGEVAIIFISANKEGFFELRQMRNDLIEQMSKNGSLDHILESVSQGRSSCTDILPGTVLRHFLYKSRSNVQYCMSSYDPFFSTPFSRRRLLSIYGDLHAQLHSRPVRLKIHYTTSTSYVALAWSSPVFELYCVAPASTSRAALAQAATALVNWAKRSEERLFLIGGAVF
ncbi:vacuolar fusion protein mon1 [Lineolata rhizophorae]|uniref:Vacuolar fusion protein MON1 n=1 Tax=Lineolata rhizophorae TaxID=578093 RepID=A0A6A6P6Q0_9PEZI|nr:vacuolar fusion protein mon1 [Lineolata rhizophorae]